MSNPDLTAALRTIAEFPITNTLLNMDAMNMRRIAEEALRAPTEAAAMAATVPADSVALCASDLRNSVRYDHIDEYIPVMRAVADRLDALTAQTPVADQPAEPSPADPLQGAANWLNEALVGCTIGDLQSSLRIGYNRAKRLFDAAQAAPKGDSNG